MRFWAGYEFATTGNVPTGAVCLVSCSVETGDARTDVQTQTVARCKWNSEQCDE